MNKTYKSRYSGTTTNLSKQDIREIPFQDLYSTCNLNATHAVQVAKNTISDANALMREKFLACLASKVDTGESGSDGVLESLQEATEVVEVTLDAEQIRELRNTEYRIACEEFAKKYTLKARAEWLPAQLMAVIAKWEPKWHVVDEISLVSPKATINAALGSADNWTRGVYLFMVHAKKGDYVDLQYKEPGSFYCALVPMILAGFKKYHKVAYNSWDKQDLHLVLEPQLLDAVTCNIPEIDAAELLAIRTEGMKIKTGTKAGQSRNPQVTHALYGVRDSMVGDLPWLAQVMLTQIWCASPTSRNNYMILDPKDWVRTPEPLIDSSPIIRKIENPVKLYRSDVPASATWDVESV